MGDSSYNAFILRVDRRFAHGFTMLASYTAGKEIDDVGEHFSGRTNISNPYNMRQGRSVADYDVPQRLVVTYIWQLRRFHAGLASKVVGAWQVNGITSIQKGMPIVITGPNSAALPGWPRLENHHRRGTGPEQCSGTPAMPTHASEPNEVP